MGYGTAKGLHKAQKKPFVVVSDSLCSLDRMERPSQGHSITEANPIHLCILFLLGPFSTCLPPLITKSIPFHPFYIIFTFCFALAAVTAASPFSSLRGKRVLFLPLQFEIGAYLG